ncbi:hypothetical protein BGZ89_005436, partial [Linnemannia elongata]
MASTGLRTLRIWMVILTFTNLVFITIHYAEGKYGSNSGTYRLDSDSLFSSSVLFLAYIYAYKIISTRLHKYLRALLMLIPTALVLLVGIQYICLVLSLDYPMPDGPPTPFDCAYLSGLERIYCGVVEFSPFFTIGMGLFALLEIYTTIRKGPMLPRGYHQSYIPNVGYAEGVNVDYVRPPEIPMTIQHPLWLQNPYGGGDGNQQSSTLNRPFFPFPSYWAFPPEQNIPNYVNSMDPAATPGPRPLQQLPSLPEEVFDNRLPIPTTVQAPVYYQPPNMPSVGAEVFDNRLPIPTSAQWPGHPYEPPNMPSVGTEVFDNRLPIPTSSQGPEYSYEPPNMPSVGTEVFDNRLPIPAFGQRPGYPNEPPNMPSVGAEVSIVGVGGSFVGQQFDVRAP